MKKTVGILSGLAVAIAAVTTVGAWYTGKRLPAELERAVSEGNQQLHKALAGTGGTASLELVSLDRHLFTSTARYRLKTKDVWLGEGEPLNLDVGIVDQIEHGPFPWSRVKSLRLMPVMATSNSQLEEDEGTASWFAAAGGQSPVQAQVSLGYAGSIDSDLRLLPLKLAEADGNSLDFSGMSLALEGDREGRGVKIKGSADELRMTLVDEDRLPVKMQFKGLRIGGDLERKNQADFFFGHMDLALDETQVVLGLRQQALVIKGLEQNNVYTAEGEEHLGGRVEYKAADISFDGRAVGSAAMLMSFKSLDVPALQSLGQWYQSRLPQIQQAAAEGRQADLVLSEQEKAQVHADLHKVLAAKPQIALEEFSFKTARGQSRLTLKAELTDPASFEVPSDQLGRQIIARLQGHLSLSKPMIGDLATLQALLEGQSDPQAIAMQSSQAGEMVGMMAVQSGLATAQGDDVVANVDYADGVVDFNGQKMSVEEFVMFLNMRLGALAPRG